MEKEAADFISTYGGQTVIDFELCRKEEERENAEKIFESIVDIRQDGVRLILEPVYNAIGFDALGDDTLKLLSIVRIINELGNEIYSKYNLNNKKLSRKNITLLKQAGYKFILGGRIKKESKKVQDRVLSLEKDPHRLNETVINGDERIIVSYSEQRAAKDRHNRDKGIQRLRKACSSGKIKKQNVNQRGYNKFLVIENDVMVSIDEEKIAVDAQWDGLKSYVTNTDLPAEEVITQ